MKQPMIHIFLSLVFVFVSQFFAVPSVHALACQYINAQGSTSCQDWPDGTSETAAEDGCRKICELRTCPEPPKTIPGNCPDEEETAKTVRLSNPLTLTDPKVIIGRVINRFVGIIGALTFLVFVYGGFQWLTSGGNEDKVKAGSQTMMWATVGLAVIFGAYAILSTFISGIAK